MTDLKTIMNSPQAGNTLLVVSAADLRTLLEDMMNFTIKTIKEHDEPSYYTRDELAQKLHISLVTLGRWRKEGKLPEPVTIDGRVLFDKAKVRTSLESCYKLSLKLKHNNVQL